MFGNYNKNREWKELSVMHDTNPFYLYDNDQDQEPYPTIVINYRKEGIWDTCNQTYPRTTIIVEDITDTLLWQFFIAQSEKLLWS